MTTACKFPWAEQDSGEEKKKEKEEEIGDEYSFPVSSTEKL